MVNFSFIGPDFHKERRGLIGASDIPAILVDPENPSKSLAGYGRTAITVYKEKTGELEREFTSSLPAEMGHYLENKSLELFIRRFDHPTTARYFRELKESYEGKKIDTPSLDARDYQLHPYYHNTSYSIDGMVVHPDMVHMANNGGIETVDGVKVNMDKDFLVEAKSAQKFAANRPEGSLVKGYDFDLTSWHGIPLKHYVQIQFQLALMQVKVGYLSLIYDTSNFQVWRVDANPKWQGRIMDIVGRMIKHINDRTIPRELAMSRDDIMEIYPKIERDYRMVVGDELERIVNACQMKEKATQQQKIWKEREDDAKDALAVMLADFEELRGGDNQLLAKWQVRKGSERIGVNPGTLKKDDPVTYRYLLKKGYIATGKDSRYVSVKYKGE